MFFVNRELWRFILVGFVNTFHYFILYNLFYHLFHMYYIHAHLLAFLISMVGSFFLNSYFTYKTKPTFRKFLNFPLAYVVHITVSTLSIYVLVQWVQLNDQLAPLLASAAAIPFTFLISKLILTKEEGKNSP